MPNHDFTFVPESPVTTCGQAFTARRNAQPEADGSWRWQVFGEALRPVGYLQSHHCDDYAGALRLRVFDAGDEPIGAAGDTHPCVAYYPHALRLLAARDGVR